MLLLFGFLSGSPILPPASQICPLPTPVSKRGFLKIFGGGLAPDGAVANVTASRARVFEGKALVGACSSFKLQRQRTHAHQLQLAATTSSGLSLPAH